MTQSPEGEEGFSPTEIDFVRDLEINEDLDGNAADGPMDAPNLFVTRERERWGEQVYLDQEAVQEYIEKIGVAEKLIEMAHRDTRRRRGGRGRTPQGSECQIGIMAKLTCVESAGRYETDDLGNAAWLDVSFRVNLPGGKFGRRATYLFRQDLDELWFAPRRTPRPSRSPISLDSRQAEAMHKLCDGLQPVFVDRLVEDLSSPAIFNRR